MRSARRFDLASRVAELREERVARELVAERRRAGRGRGRRASRAGSGRRACARSRAACPSRRPGRSARPTEPAKSRSPLNRQPSAWKATCAGEWPGMATHSKEIPATSTVSPPSSRWSGVYRRPGAPARREVRVLLEQGALALGHPDGRAGALGEVGDAAEVVEVAVRDQDRGAGRAACGPARAAGRPRLRPGRSRPPRLRRGRRGRRGSWSGAGRARSVSTTMLIERESSRARTDVSASSASASCRSVPARRLPSSRGSGGRRSGRSCT